jgi:hypothetical protein
MDLQHKLERVSRHHLFGQPVPAELRALWQLMTTRRLAADRQALTLLWERLTLLDLAAMQEHPVFFERYTRTAMLERCEAEGLSPAPFEPRFLAYDDVIDKMAFFAIDSRSRFIGYWLGNDREIPVEEAPIAVLDERGRFAIVGRSLIEFLMTEILADEPSAAVALRRHASEQLGPEWVKLAQRMRHTNLTELAAIHGDPQGLFKQRVLERTSNLKVLVPNQD